MQEQILGDYKILKQIGQGSLGTVFLAEHRFIKKSFILKVLHEELTSDKNFVQRFEEEIGRLASLDHPKIVKIHNVSYAQGYYFLVTDCIVDSIGETTNLSQYMMGRKEKLREEELMHLLRQIAEALDYAHERQIAHRTLKLNNILIGKGKLGIEVFISDFGLSKMVGSGPFISRTFQAIAEAFASQSLEKGREHEEKYAPIPVEGVKLSKMTHSFLQNYAFLAPEQKKIEAVGVQADIYAYGVLAFYLISGLFPEGMPLTLAKIAPEYTRDWDRLVQDCLQYYPEKRPKKLVNILEEIGKDVPSIVAKPLPPISALPFRIHPEEQKRERPSPEAIQPLISQKIREEEKEEEKQEEMVLVSAHHTANSTTSEAKSAVMHESKMETIAPQQSTGSSLREPLVTHYHQESQEKKHSEPMYTEMVVIEGGEFYRGSADGNRDEIPRHRIRIDRFAIDIHSVTNEQFLRFLSFMGSEKDAHYNDLIRLKESRINRAGGKLSIEAGYGRHPVVGVTWYGASAYAEWIGKRLPTEAEWEIASRGGNENALFPTGGVIDKSQANFFSSDTTPVMTYSPNPLGLYDMAGNVYEWCQDWYGYNYYETSQLEPNNPKGPQQGVYRVLRGGCWKSLKEDLRCSHRHRNNPGTVIATYGFRCASDV